ncbi:MAG: para-nitrobenzyl esterase [Mucilaginibacter sp.]|nr:para-nitrobenzyl esterase [Mucilaginibacter sp.]
MFYSIKSKRTAFWLVLLVFVVSLVKAQNAAPVVITNKGYISGIAENDIIVFKGIPYAAPPIGRLRFKATQEHAPWTDTLAANKFGAIATQASGGSEDCLTLNVYTPKTDQAKRPVLVWVHGGSMTSGSGKGQDGHAFSDRDDIVTVSINYRLGIFGFTYLDDVGAAYAGSSNNGVLDCIMALKWIKQNIAAFGGDPDKVTIMGESAGAKLVSAVLVSPKSKGLFQQYIAESGSVQCVRDINTARNERSRILQQLHLKEQDAAKLLTLPADSLMKAQNQLCNDVTGLLFIGPVNDGVVINNDPYHYAADKNLPPIKALIGTNATEATVFADKYPRLKAPDTTILKALFADNYPMVYQSYLNELHTLPPYEASVKTLTRYMYEMHTYRWAKSLAANNILVWMYRFDYANDPLGAAHAKELPFVWYNTASKAMKDTAKRQLAVNMHKAWVAFIKTGNPNTAGLPQWPVYKNDNRQIMIFNTTSKVIGLKEVFDDKNFPSTVMTFKN